MNKSISNLIDVANRVVAGKVNPNAGRTRLVMLSDIEALKAAADSARRAPRKHAYWRAGDADCPGEIKAPNGELHTLRCKVCGMDNPAGDCES